MSVAFLVSILYSVMNIYLFMILGYIIMSWIPSLQQSAIGNFLAAVVEPYLSIFRRIIPPIGMIDLSPIIAIFALQIAFRGLTQVLYWIF
ncbi:YggT family protein [Chryseomicrobium aureum]|uniref:YggT family protein n=1 Tax=Chryseomicrobium aureum TaxID=1441723 RepID=UPI0019580BB6|nr:YggT family protein [Chryseomicrobium aureum]MBM7705338.1 YggT family protein [Chryseomicrobium aureum]